MAGMTATPKQTGGAGYSFEDMTGAYFCIRLLQGSYPFDPLLGTIQRIKFQNRVDGWLLDDLLLTLDDTGGQRQCGLSVRSNIQFGKTTAPLDFVAAVWAMFLQEGTEAFTRERDFLGLVTAPLQSDTRVPLMELLRLAQSQPPEDLARRLLDESQDTKGYASPEVRKIFKSFSCPQELAEKCKVSDSETASLLKHLIFRQFDFLDPYSHYKADCLAACQYLLRNGTPENAAHLWASLLKTVNEVRTAGGTLDRADLVAILRTNHELDEFPDFRQDWERLSSWGRERLRAVPDAIGGSLRLQREEVVSRVSNAMGESRFAAVIGESGSGKSVICKNAADRFPGSTPILWFHFDMFVRRSFEILRAEIGLAHSLPDVLRALTTQKGLVVLDGLENLSTDESWRQVRLLLQHVQAGKAASPWFVLLSCRSEHWEFVQARLLQAGVPPGALRVEEVGPFDAEDLRQVGQVFPALAPVIYRAHLRPLITKPKILDVFARHKSLSATDVERWSGESDLVEWYWQEVIRRGDAAEARSAFLQMLAEKQADSNFTHIPIVDVSPAHQLLLPALELDGTCSLEHERVAFSHDLLADWSRQRLLLARQGQLESFLLHRVLNPQWHRAIHLYGLWLLEQQGADAWLKEYKRLETIAPPFFDSAFLGVCAGLHLEALWPHLTAENGRLLRLLLIRFLHAATYPHPLADTVGQEGDRELARYISAHVRIPLWNYWPPVLQVLSAHQDEVIDLVPHEAAQIALVWLQYTRAEWAMRREAAHLALAIGERTFLSRLGDSYHNDEKDRVKYKAALAAAHELPDEVSDFALRVAARRLIPEVEQNLKTGYLPPGGSIVTTTSMIYSETQVVPEPWSDGPMYRVDEAFRYTCLSEAALQLLMIKRPVIAKEVILALLISCPVARSANDRRDSDYGKHVRITSDAQFIHAFYLDGPFLTFLNVNWREAIDCILRLVDFATERWTDNLASAKGACVPVHFVASLKGPRCFAGDTQVLSWYRGPWAAGAVKSALQATEKWFYDTLERESDVAEQAIELILMRGRSAAFLGMLWEIGRFRPCLFRGPLKALLACARLYFWETEAVATGLADIGLITSPLQSKERLQLIHEWETMPHRKMRVEEIAIGFLLQSKVEAEFFDACRRQWGREREYASFGGFPVGWYDSLIAGLISENWSDVDLPEVGTVKQFIPPKEMVEQQEQLKERNRESEPFWMVRACRAVLNGEKALETDQCSVFVEKIREIGALDPETEENQRSRTAAVCAGIAVLLHTQFAWVKESPEREEWCRAVLLQALADLPPDRSPWAECDESGLSAEDFAAEAITVLWAAAPTDERLRENVAALAASQRWSATRRLVYTALERREELGRSFDQLVHFVIRLAELNHELAVAKWRAGSPPDVDLWEQRYGRPFIDGSLSTDPESWGETAVNRGKRTPVGSRFHGEKRQKEPGVYRIEPRIHRPFLLKAFGSVMMPNQARNEKEREEWMKFWQQVLQCELAEVRTFDLRGSIVLFPEREQYIPPTENFADTYAHLILQCPPRDAERFWKPILDLGPSGGLWLEWFLTEFLAEGLSHVRREVFLPMWRAMIAYASQSVAWTNPQSAWVAWNEQWQHLLGFAPIERDLWQSQHTDAVGAMRDMYESLTIPNLGNNWWASAFVGWLRRPAAAPLRVEALAWLLPVAEKEGGSWWSGDRLEDDLSEVLAICWEEHRSEILARQEILLAHRTLVALLVIRHNALAMELQDKMASGG